MLDAEDTDEEIGTITCWESNEPEKAKNKRLRASEAHDKNTRSESTEHKEHDENGRCQTLS